MKNLHNSQDGGKIWSELDMMWCQRDSPRLTGIIKAELRKKTKPMEYKLFACNI